MGVTKLRDEYSGASKAFSRPQKKLKEEEKLNQEIKRLFYATT